MAGALLGALTLVGLIVLPAIAAAATGSISGTVTDSLTHDPVAGVYVCASYEDAESFEEGCETTDQGGKYTIGGLGSGEYQVEFWPSIGGLNYLTQYYRGKSNWEEAEPVSVSDGLETPNIDAALEEGGQIEGRVVDAVSEAGLEGVWVCAYEVNEEGFGGCTDSDVNGEYVLPGLSTGSYEVQFWPKPGSGYLVQYYSGRQAPGEANLVPVTVGTIADEINAAMQVGGRITGTVVDAASGRGLDEIELCAFGLGGGEFVGCELTSPGGSYELEELPAGMYKVEFSPETEAGEYDDGYFNQYFEGGSSWESAQWISVSAGGTVPGVNARLVAKASSGSSSGGSSPFVVKTPPPESAPAGTSGAPQATVPHRPKCRKGFKAMGSKGKLRCVPRQRKHHHRGSAAAAHR